MERIPIGRNILVTPAEYMSAERRRRHLQKIMDARPKYARLKWGSEALFRVKLYEFFYAQASFGFTYLPVEAVCGALNELAAALKMDSHHLDNDEEDNATWIDDYLNQKGPFDPNRR